MKGLMVLEEGELTHSLYIFNVTFGLVKFD